ncbi:MAG TPA: dipeptide epimerase [Chloroflexota bacterium]|nr:dipeptide epimerase [Chloroflexota bacterium]
MDARHEALNLTLRRPFTISRGTQTVACNVLVTLCDGDHQGIGEAAPSPYYGETQPTVAAILDDLLPALATDSLAPSTLHERMQRTIGRNPAAKAAVDMAAYDLLGRRLDAPVYDILGLDPAGTPVTSYTIGIAAPDVMARDAAAAGDFPILKVKVGTPHDVANLEAIRGARPDAVIRVDANAAWSAKEAVSRLEELLPFDLEFVEQPVHAADLDGLSYVRDAIPIPVIADESCVVPEDVPRVAPHVDGINIKLMKCGGISPALQMIATARAHNLLVMAGCMIESSLAITAAAQISPLLDYADLDGNLLVSDDPFTGVVVDAGRLILPEASGLGVAPR